MPLSNFESSVTSHEMKSFSENRIELRNLQILKKMLENSSQFLLMDDVISMSLVGSLMALTHSLDLIN